MDLYWVSPIPDIWNATPGLKWSLTSGGVGGAPNPTIADNVKFDANSLNNCTVTATAACNDLDCTGYTGTFAGSSNISCGGSLTWGSGMTRTYTGTITFTSTATGKTITSNGKTFGGNITFNGAGGGWSFFGALGTSGNITNTAGSIDDGGYSVTANAYLSNNSNTRSLTKSGVWTITGNSGTIWNTATSTGQTINDTGTLNFTASAAANRTISFGASPNAFNVVNITNGSDTVTLATGALLNTLDFTGFSGALAISTAINIKTSLVLSPTMTSNNSVNVGVSFIGAGAMSMASSGVVWNKPVALNSSTGSLDLLDNLDNGGSSTNLTAFTITAGIFNTNNHDIVTGLFSSTNSNTRTINLGSSKIRLKAANTGVMQMSNTAGLTLNAGTSEFIIDDTGANTKIWNSGASATFNKVNFTGNGVFEVNGGGTYGELDVTAGQELDLRDGVTTTIGALSLNGSAGNLTKIRSKAAGVKASLSKSSAGLLNLDYVDVSDIDFLNGYNTFATHSLNSGNNAGIAFCSPKQAASGMMALAA